MAKIEFFRDDDIGPAFTLQDLGALSTDDGQRLAQAFATTYKFELGANADPLVNLGASTATMLDAKERRQSEQRERMNALIARLGSQ